MIMIFLEWITHLWDGDKLVGLLSTISDTMHVYITYLLVDPSYQNRKIGTKLLNMFEKHYVNYKKELKTEKASDYYKRFGWHSESVGMVKNSEEDAYFIILAVADIVTGISTLGGFNHE